MADNSYKAQLAVMNALQGHEVDSLIDCLVEKLGLVKFLLKDGSGNPMEAAATHVVEAILSYLADRNNSVSARKRFEKTQLQRVFFMVANLTLSSLNSGPDRASLLMQTCIIVDRHCPELKDTASAQATLYQVLASYHTVYPKTNEHIRRALSYADGALLAINMVATSDASPEKKLMNDVQRAVALNNKATIEIRSRNLGGAQDLVMQALKLVEHRVFTLIDSGFHQNAEIAEMFQSAVKVLVHSYYNLGLTKESQLESKELFRRGLQLFH